VDSARLDIRNISKRYGAVEALVDVSFSVAPGEIHALVGENGAGKSTLVKIITGLVPQDAGEILLDGARRTFHTPMDARSAGVTAVYQDPKLFPHLDVAENIFMGVYPTTATGAVDRRGMYLASAELLSRLDVDLWPRSLVAGLSVAELQFVEIARALATDLRLLILDEPTSSLTPTEAGKLFQIVRSLKEHWTSIVFISHRLEEVLELSDRITVLRDGRFIATRPRAELDQGEIVSAMVGRKLTSFFAAEVGGRPPGDVRLLVDRLTRVGAFYDVSFSLRAGEIVGMAGLVGAGRSEIAQTIFGVLKPTSGSVSINGSPVEIRDPMQMIDLGVAYLPEDRDTQGLVTEFSVASNISLPVVGKLSSGGFLRRDRERHLAERYARDFQIKTGDVQDLITSLSGGNRQKAVLAKWLTTNPSVLILDEPTHGIDVGAKIQVHEKIHELARSGIAVLLISSDLPEILGMSDRIIVVADGRVAAELPRAEATQERVLLAASAAHNGA